VDRHTVPLFALCTLLSWFVSCLRRFHQKGNILKAKIAQNRREQSPSVKYTHNRRPASGKEKRDVGGIWDWDIGNGNAILLEADAGDIYGHVAVALMNERMMTLPGGDYHSGSFDHFTRIQMT
jgi:hypothetical protein